MAASSMLTKREKKAVILCAILLKKKKDKCGAADVWKMQTILSKFNLISQQSQPRYVKCYSGNIKTRSPAVWSRLFGSSHEGNRTEELLKLKDQNFFHARNPSDR